MTDISAAPAGFAPSGDRIPLDSTRGWWIICLTALGSGMIFLDSSVVNVALPAIQNDLNTSLASLEWIVNAYTLFLAALLMIGGGIGDAYGRKGAFLAGLGIFTIASAACGFAPNVNVLIAARAAQGIGGALLVPGSLATIKSVITPEDSGRAIGRWAGLSGVSAAAGPILGGYLIDATSWRAIFYLNLPLGVVTAIGTWLYMPRNRDPDASRSLDWPAGVAAFFGLGGLTYALIEGPAYGAGDSRVLAGLVLAVLGIIGFLVRETRAAHPMIPLDTFRSRTFNGANLATIGVYFSFGGFLLYLVLDLQQIQGYSPLAAGAATAPVVILLLVLSPRVGRLMNQYGVRLPLALAPVIIAVGFLLFLRMGHPINYVTDVLPGTIVVGIGMSLFVTPLTMTVMAAVPDRLAGVASGISNTLTRIASLLAVAVLGLIVVSRFHDALSARLDALHVDRSARAALLSQADRLANDPIPRTITGTQRASVVTAIDDAYINGFRWDMVTCAAFCLASAAISLTTVRDRDIQP